MNRTVVFILYMDNDNVELIRNLNERSREVDIGVSVVLADEF